MALKLAKPAQVIAKRPARGWTVVVIGEGSSGFLDEEFGP